MVKIITDSSADLPPNIISQYDIRVIPAIVIFGNKRYLDGININHRQFYHLLETDYFHPVTAPGTPYHFYKVYKELEGYNEDILVITLPKSLSDFIESAQIAADYSDFSNRIEVFDSKGVSGKQGLLVLKAAKMAEKGYNIDDIMMELTSFRDSIEFYAIAPTTDALVRGGRTSATIGKLASILGLFILLTWDGSTIEKFATPRGFDKGYQLIIDQLKTKFKRNQPLTAIMIDALNTPEVVNMENQLQEHFNIVEVVYSNVGGTIGSNAGRGTVGIAIAPYLDE